MRRANPERAACSTRVNAPNVSVDDAGVIVVHDLHDAVAGAKRCQAVRGARWWIQLSLRRDTGDAVAVRERRKHQRSGYAPAKRG